MFAQDCSEEELRAVCKELFIPQCDHGIDAHGAARRDIASHECNSGEDDNLKAVRGWPPRWWWSSAVGSCLLLMIAVFSDWLIMVQQKKLIIVQRDKLSGGRS
jgi:hypothetical protein